ncbi:MAG: transposase [Gammaproteobacteria bacterium]|nr:transposase [Gammaproteobacteria bacterium]
MSKRARRSYTTEYKIEAVRQVTETSKTVAQVARELGIHENLLRKWVKDKEVIEALPPTQESKDDEIRRLRAELESVREDNEILKKAAAYFAKHSR